MSFFVIGQESTYTVSFKENVENLNITQNTTILIFQKDGNNIKLISGEAMGLPKSSGNDIIIINNLKAVSSIQFKDEAGNSKTLKAGSSNPIKSDAKWTKITFYSKEGEMVGNQEFNTLF